MQEFNLDKKTKLLFKGCLVIFVGFLLLGFALPFIPDDGKTNTDASWDLTIICTIVFGFFAIMAWRTLKKLPYVDVVVDDDGLWYRHKPKKEGLVPWKQIAEIKERLYLQCLDILDSDGRRLIRIEYQLNDFETLRNILTDKLSDALPKGRHTQFSKNILYHFFSAACIAGFSWLGLYVGKTSSPWLGYAGMGVLVSVIAYEYLATVYRIDVEDNGLLLAYPTGTKRVAYSDISRIEMADTFQKGSRIPEVWVIVKNVKKPYKLKQLGVDASYLLITLKKAWEMES